MATRYFKTLAAPVVVTDTTPVAIFTVPVGANKTYEVDILASFTAGSVATGHTPSFTVPAGATITWCSLTPIESSGQLGNGLLPGSSGRAAAVVPTSQGTTETPILIKARITTAGASGNLVFLMASETTNDITVTSGSRLLIKLRTSGSDIVVAGSDVVTTSNTVYSPILSFSLAANKSYFIDVVLETDAAASTTGVRAIFEGLPVDATLSSEQWHDTTTAVNGSWRIAAVQLAAVSAKATPIRGCIRIRALVKTTTTTGTLNLSLISEISGSAVTVYAGSFGVLDDLTGVIGNYTSDKVATDSAYVVLNSFVLSTNRSYYFRDGNGVLSDSSTTGVTHRFNGVPSGATLFGFLYGGGSLAGANTAYALRTDDTAAVGTVGNTSIDIPVFSAGMIDVAGTGGTLTHEFVAESGGTVTANGAGGSGGWYILEEVTAFPDAPTVDAAPAPAASYTVGASFNYTAAATGAPGGTWDTSAGTVPSGTARVGTTGEIDGEVDTPETASWTDRYTDLYGQTGTRARSTEIVSAPAANTVLAGFEVGSSPLGMGLKGMEL